MCKRTPKDTLRARLRICSVCKLLFISPPLTWLLSEVYSGMFPTGVVPIPVAAHHCMGVHKGHGPSPCLQLESAKIAPSRHPQSTSPPKAWEEGRAWPPSFCHTGLCSLFPHSSSQTNWDIVMWHKSVLCVSFVKAARSCWAWVPGNRSILYT